VHQNLEEADLSTQLINCIYFSVVTLMTVGYGDILPRTNTEKFFSICTIIAGAIFYAVRFGNVVLFIENRDKNRNEHRMRHNDLKEFAELYGIQVGVVTLDSVNLDLPVATKHSLFMPSFVPHLYLSLSFPFLFLPGPVG
jgi:hypothetical protein